MQNELVHELNASGTPSASWSDQDLDRFERKVNRLERLRSQLDQMNGRNGVMIWGGENTLTIQNWRNAIANARAQKSASQLKAYLDKLDENIQRVDEGIEISKRLQTNTFVTGDVVLKNHVDKLGRILISKKVIAAALRESIEQLRKKKTLDL